MYILFFVQSVLLEDHVRDLRRVIRPGAKRLNWNSLGIKDFCHKCEQVCFQSTVIYVLKETIRFELASIDISFNPYLTNGFSHHYHLDKSTFIFRGVRSDF